MRSPDPPQHVSRALTLQRWDALTFLHWTFPPETVQALLPSGLAVQTFDGLAWVGLTPFEMQGVRAPGLPAVPGVSAFPETNVRTYVEGFAGEGVWFFSLDAARLPVAVALRGVLGLPYCWARMRVERSAEEVRYSSTRRAGGAPARSHIRVRPGRALVPSTGDDHVRFLTARWRAYSVAHGRLVATPVDHPPWHLQEAEVTALHEDLLAAAGLHRPEGEEPLVHYSPGVAVRIGVPRPAGWRGATRRRG